ncbi:MAG: hypothetical protein HOV86_35960 [Thermoactinospora sp.]|nr:hypothetical protein [Thermoactinospora sp.]
MNERADQLVLDYVARAADAAHGVLRPDQRIDFVKRLRASIERERGDARTAKDVAKVLARFGDPRALVEREVRQLNPVVEPPPEEPRKTAQFPAVGPRIVDDVPPGVIRGRQLAERHLSRPPRRRSPFAGLRNAFMSSANPYTTEGRDAWTILQDHPREVTAMVLFLIAGLMVPFHVGELAIFELPVLVWAVGAVLTLISEGWTLRERLWGLASPMVGYALGGALVAAVRLGGFGGFERFMTEFWAVSGIMFMIGAGLGVARMAYQLLNG